MQPILTRFTPSNKTTLMTSTALKTTLSTFMRPRK